MSLVRHTKAGGWGWCTGRAAPHRSYVIVPYKDEPDIPSVWRRDRLVPIEHEDLTPEELAQFMAAKMQGII